MWRKAKRLLLGSGQARHWLLYICTVFIFLCHIALHYRTDDGGASRAENSASEDIVKLDKDAQDVQNIVHVTRHLEGPPLDSDAVESDRVHPSKGLAFMSNVTKLDWASETGAGSFNRPSQTVRYQYNCSNIHHITMKRKLGHGVSKQVYLGEHEGQKVAIKMVTRNALDVTSCVKKKEREGTYKPEEKSQCYSFPNMKLMKEILLLEQLKHPNLIKMLGYCVRSEETESTSLKEHGVLAIHEYALRFYISTLLNWPFQMRAKTAIELADLLDYLEHSPLGSLRISDFKDAHFLMKDGRIKLTDMDDVTSVEPSCDTPTGHGQSNQGRGCSYKLQCIGGICPGENAKKNMENMHKLFFKEILFGSGTSASSFQKDVDQHGAAILSELKTRLDGNDISARDLKGQLYSLLNVPYIPGYS